jgi:hypothetical protein
VVNRKNAHSLVSTFEVTTPKVILLLIQIEFKPFPSIPRKHLLTFIDVTFYRKGSSFPGSRML